MRRILILILVMLLPSSASLAGIPGFMKARMGTLQGQLYVDGKILPNAIISFFDKKGGPPPILGSARRVPDMVARTDDKAKFSVKLLPGSYYMGSLIRERGKGPGPPQKGEQYFFIRDQNGQLQSLVVKTKSINKVGRLNGVPPGKFKEFEAFITISGKVIDETNKPCSGALVTLKDKLNAPRPKYIAKPTDEQGKFSVKVPPGKYYLMVRESLRDGRPAIGSSVGTYGKVAPKVSAASRQADNKNASFPAGMSQQGGSGTAIAVGGEKGEIISGIVINMFKIPDPNATRNEYKKKARASEMNSKAKQ